MHNFEFVLVESGAASAAALLGSSDQNHVFLLGCDESLQCFGNRVVLRARAIRGVLQQASRCLVKVTYLVGSRRPGDWRARHALLAALAAEMDSSGTILVNAPSAARAPLLLCLAALQCERADLTWRARLSSHAPESPRAYGTERLRFHPGRKFSYANNELATFQSLEH